jgi:hypothetical protein
MKKENLKMRSTHLCLTNIEKFNTLEFNPILKKLLKRYVSMMYEESSIYDDEALISEYIYLYENKKLHELFDWEFLKNSLFKY